MESLYQDDKEKCMECGIDTPKEDLEQHGPRWKKYFVCKECWKILEEEELHKEYRWA